VREKRVSPPYYIWLSRSLVRRRLWGPGDPIHTSLYGKHFPEPPSQHGIFGTLVNLDPPYSPPKELKYIYTYFSTFFFHYPLLSAVRDQSWADGTYSMAWLRAPVRCCPLGIAAAITEKSQNGLASFHLPLLSAHCRIGNRLGARSVQLQQGHTLTRTRT
jgi:hypothetical protein